MTETVTVAAPQRETNRGNELGTITRRGFLTLAAGSAAGLAIYSGEFARHEIDVVERTVFLAGLPESFSGFRVLQISDIHFAEFTEATFLDRVVSRINRLRPDLVALTGDFVSDEPLPRRFGKKMSYICAEILGRIACPLRYAVLGNHDVKVNSWAVTDALHLHGIPVLHNASVPIERDGARFWLSGSADVLFQKPDLDAALAAPMRDGAEAIVLMLHEPDYADYVVERHKVSLILSGHSHGGQVRLPGFGPVVLPYMGSKYVMGQYLLRSDVQLYVNRGIGTVGVPLRLFCPPEITVHTLQPGKASAGAS